MKSKVKLAGVVVIEVNGTKFMCGTTTDGRFAHKYTPDGKMRRVTCAHTTAEECYAHHTVLGTKADGQMSEETQKILDWAIKNGYGLPNLGKAEVNPRVRLNNRQRHRVDVITALEAL
jgi:hypothetical protein